MTKKIFENYFQQNLKEVRYTIRRGDTLSRIARKFGLSSWRKIMKANPDIKNPNRIRAGQVINIPGSFRSTRKEKGAAGNYVTYDPAFGRQSDDVGYEEDHDILASLVPGQEERKKILQKAKQYAGFQRIHDFAWESRQNVLYNFVSLGPNGPWAKVNSTAVITYLDGGGRQDFNIQINIDMFYKSVTKILNNGLSKAKKYIEATNKEQGIQTLPEEYENLKFLFDDFAALWLSTALVHEYSHMEDALEAMDDNDGEDPKLPVDYAPGMKGTELRARKAETVHMGYIKRRINQNIRQVGNIMRDVYGVRGSKLKEILVPLFKVWQDVVDEQEQWYSSRKHTDQFKPDFKSGFDGEKFDREAEEAQKIADKIKGVQYTVRKGDTLGKIAKLARTSVKKILAANPGLDPDKIYPGDIIKVPVGPVDLNKLVGRGLSYYRKNIAPKLSRFFGTDKPNVVDKFNIQGVQENSQGKNIKMKNINESQNEKIFNNYFKQNLKENAEISTSDPAASDIADIVVDEINAVFEDLPDDSPLKNREVALAALAKIKAGLPAMIQGLDVS